MQVKTKAFLLNLFAFGIFFIFFRTCIGLIMPLPYLPLLLGSAVLASFCAPKFLVKKNEIWVKYPWNKDPKKP